MLHILPLMPQVPLIAPKGHAYAATRTWAQEKNWMPFVHKVGAVGG